MERFIEVIGEAASKVSASTQREVPSVRWREIIGMRNRLVHGYASVDHDIVWNVVTTDLQALVAELERALGARG